MDRMAQAIAAALRVLNPAGLEPTPPASDAAKKPCDNCDKHPDNRDNFPPRAT
jgi:hypothetical protein